MAITTTIVIIIALAIYIAAYFGYGRRIIERKIVKPSPDRKTPAYKFYDGVDYVPTNKYVLMGHHFASIAGAVQ